ncbi:hypothetical protein TrVE_jg1333 [Triparma verrucosa]|uniref:Casein kinase II subunit beta n=1 Tax=Triparma verrucosa TaxID=1606542 RepID=A0A9W7FI79_9STRA|nr:hypothetical protein TrVE_jg1333 [Triparma verrucosa]
MDAFNLYGLRAITPNFTSTLNTLLDRSPPTPLPPTIRLYGQIHSRYILTPPGLLQMSEKYLSGDFGFCPLLSCRSSSSERQRCLPTGLSDVCGTSSVKLYCPKCQNTFDTNLELPNIDGEEKRENGWGGVNDGEELGEIDGAHFGTSFVGSFFLGNPELVPEGKCVTVPPCMKVFGFKVHGSSVALQPSVREAYKRSTSKRLEADGDEGNRKKIKRN